jgi:hypothetical protein
VSKDRNKGGREARKPKKAKPAPKPVTQPEQRIPAKNITQSQQSQ